MEIRKKVTMYQVDQTCQACGNGDMRPAGACLTVNPPLFPHKCNVCGHAETYPVAYPCIDYRGE